MSAARLELQEKLSELLRDYGTSRVLDVLIEASESLVTVAHNRTQERIAEGAATSFSNAKSALNEFENNHEVTLCDALDVCIDAETYVREGELDDQAVGKAT